jgi:hypothetical protein
LNSESLIEASRKPSLRVSAASHPRFENREALGSQFGGGAQVSPKPFAAGRVVPALQETQGAGRPLLLGMVDPYCWLNESVSLGM